MQRIELANVLPHEVRVADLESIGNPSNGVEPNRIRLNVWNDVEIHSLRLR